MRRSRVLAFRNFDEAGPRHRCENTPTAPKPKHPKVGKSDWGAATLYQEQWSHIRSIKEEGKP